MSDLDPAIVKRMRKASSNLFGEPRSVVSVERAARVAQDIRDEAVEAVEVERAEYRRRWEEWETSDDPDDLIAQKLRHELEVAHGLIRHMSRFMDLRRDVNGQWWANDWIIPFSISTVEDRLLAKLNEERT